MLQLVPITLRIKQIYDDGSHAKHFTFEPVTDVIEQHVELGQFFMLSVPGAGLAPFTYTSLPDHSGCFNALVRKVGKLTDALLSMKEGDLVGYNGPFGNPWPVSQLQKGEVLIVAGGCGLAPLAATIDYLIAQGKGQQVSLIYGAHDVESQVLRRERNDWQSKINLFETLSITDKPDHHGRTTAHIEHVIQQRSDLPNVVLTCGPEAMMQSTAQVCNDMGIQNNSIWLSMERRMRCAVGLCGHCYFADSYVCKQGPTYRYDEYLELKNKTVKSDAHKGAFQFC